MSSEEGKFYKFPRTAHIEGSSVVDDDESVPLRSLVTSLSSLSNITLLFQEKVDGANVSVYFEEEWVPILQKRSGLIGQGEVKQYDMFRNWVYEHLEPLFAVVGTQYVLFGEWLWCQHGLPYNNLPDWFMAFDMLDKTTLEYLPYTQLKEKADAAGIAVVPLLWSGEVRELAKAMSAAVGKKSKFGDELVEGVYVRAETAERVIDRWKYRRGGFVAGREDFGTNILTNSLGAGSSST